MYNYQSPDHCPPLFSYLLMTFLAISLGRWKQLTLSMKSLSLLCTQETWNKPWALWWCNYKNGNQGHVWLICLPFPKVLSNNAEYQSDSWILKPKRPVCPGAVWKRKGCIASFLKHTVYSHKQPLVWVPLSHFRKGELYKQPKMATSAAASSPATPLSWQG